LGRFSTHTSNDVSSDRDTEAVCIAGVIFDPPKPPSMTLPVMAIRYDGGQTIKDIILLGKSAEFEIEVCVHAGCK
jgi:hypothetical protein